MKKDAQRDRATARIAAHILKNGLSATSLRQLAAAAGTSDRMLLYYFDNKADVLASAFELISVQLATQLNAAIDSKKRLPPVTLFQKASTQVRSAELRPYMRLWNEIVTAAARGEAPYTAMADRIATGFLDWVETRLAVDNKKDRKQQAAMILVMVEGLSIMDACADGEISDLAVRMMSRTMRA